MSKKLYHERDVETIDDAGGFYFRHVMAMTSEQLHSKSDIAAELGFRDMIIDELESKLLALQAERDALVVQMIGLNKLHSDLTNADMVLDDGEHSGYLITSEQLEDMEHYLSEPILCLAAHDAEVAKKAVQVALRMYGSTDLSNKEIIALSENYAASLNK